MVRLNLGHHAVLLSTILAAEFTGCHAFAALPSAFDTGLSRPAGAGALASTAKASERSSAVVEVGGQKSPPDETECGEVGPVERTIELLDGALGLDASAASAILDRVAELRTSGAQGEVEEFLDEILSVVDGDGVVLPFWARVRPLARFSRRARRASLRRVLDLSTPAAEETENGSIGDSAEASKRSRRRAFVVLLRTLAAAAEEDSKDRTPFILSVERAARRDAREGATSEDLSKRLPPGLETPDYTVVARRPPRKGGFEIRSYEAFSVCSVPMGEPRPSDATRTDARVSNPQISGASSFGALAGYLFGKNKESKAMKMTTPVLTVGEGDDRTMSFVLPSDYWGEDGDARAPQPLDGSGVRLERDSGGYRAAIMFGGYASKAVVERRKAQLLEGLEKDAQFEVVEGAPVTLLQYNDPFTPPWKRRNEVAVPVVARQE